MSKNQISYLNLRAKNHSPNSNNLGPVVVFLHGFMGYKEQWLDVCENHLHPLNQNIISYLIDLPGHGDAPIFKAQNQINYFSELAKHYLDFFKAQNLKDITLVGYSMGARLALQIALNDHDHHDKKIIKTLILESGHLGMSNATEKKDRLIEDQNKLISLLNLPLTEREAAFKHFLMKWYENPIFTGQVTNLNSIIQKANLKNLQHALENLSLGNMPFDLDKIKKLEKKIYYFYGLLDAKYCSYVSTFKQLGPKNITLVSIPHASHNTHLMNPISYAKELNCAINS